MYNLFKNLLLVLLGFCGGVLAAQWRYQNQLEETAAYRACLDSRGGAESGVTLVYYFHGEYRCDACNALERDALAALQADFPAQLADGTLQWRVLNRQAPENAELARKFGLVSNQLVAESGGRFKVLDRAWDFADDPEALRRYLASELDALRR